MAGIRDAISRMDGYTPGEQRNAPDIVKLNTNENPYSPSPSVLDALHAAITGDKLRKYPQATGQSFRQTAARVLGVDPDCIVIGNGSDDILTILTRTYVPEGGLIVSPSPSYSLYKSLAEIQGARFDTVPWGPNWSLPVLESIPRDTSLFFLANPNSPSGTCIPIRDVEAFAAKAPFPVVVDEAYADFASENALRLISLPNVIVTRTLSKSYSLAGLRFGFAAARPETIREFIKVKDSYNCDALSLAGAEAALADQEYLKECTAKLLATRSRMERELPKLGFAVTPSHANFVWCQRSDRPCKPIYEALKERNILVRYMAYAGYGDGLRISVGSDAEIDFLMKALREIIG